MNQPPCYKYIDGIGNDVIEIQRIRKAYLRHTTHFLDKCFTKAEQEYCLKHKDPAPRLAGRFAAKEAIVKALGIGFNDGFNWVDIEILNNVKGAPQAILSSHWQEKFLYPEILITISHCKEYAMATAIVQRLLK